MDSDEQASNCSESLYIEEQVHSWHKHSQPDVSNTMKTVSAEPPVFRKSAKSA